MADARMRLVEHGDGGQSGCFEQVEKWRSGEVDEVSLKRQAGSLLSPRSRKRQGRLTATKPTKNGQDARSEPIRGCMFWIISCFGARLGVERLGGCIKRDPPERVGSARPSALHRNA